MAGCPVLSKSCTKQIQRNLHKEHLSVIPTALRAMRLTIKKTQNNNKKIPQFLLFSLEFRKNDQPQLSNSS